MKWVVGEKMELRYLFVLYFDKTLTFRFFFFFPLEERDIKRKKK